MSQSYPFDPGAIRIAVQVYLHGPLRGKYFLFSLDTAATRTSIRPQCLQDIGIDMSQPAGQVSVRGVTGIGTASTYVVPSLTALGHESKNVTVIAQDFPKSVTVHGLLGLDFYRGRIFTIDFDQGFITLRPPRSRWRFWQ